MPTYAVNKKARHDYEILETYEAGLMLTGQEVKSVRSGQMKLLGAYVTFHDTGAYLLNAHIPKYKFTGHLEGYQPDRSRKLLLKEKEITYLRGKLAEKGLTIIPLSVYTKGQRIKVEIGVGRGKKAFDKRENLKKRDTEREMRRRMKE